MKISLISATGNLKEKEKMLESGQKYARVCYTEKSWDELQGEAPNERLLEQLLNSGHHSVFEHVNLTFNFDGLPKILAMIFNNEKQYATSEKSARYTVMSDIEPEQKKLFDEWKDILIPAIDEIYPLMDDAGTREKNIKKIAQENARYMTSIFTPTKMVHTINLRQLNFIQQEFEEFIQNPLIQYDYFTSKIGGFIHYFLEQTEQFRVEGLNNQTDRHLSLFDNTLLTPSNQFGDNYSRKYFMSFAGLAQAHRHRTIKYNILSGTDLGAPNGFFIPPILRKNKLEREWVADLENIAEKDIPQAQLLEVYERGTIEDFRSKALLRICGHAQLEIMQNTKKTASVYEPYLDAYGEHSLEPKCMQGMKCASPCVWGGKRALDRLI